MWSTLLLYIGQEQVQNILVYWKAGPDANFLGTARNEDKGLIFRNDGSFLTRCSWSSTDFPEATWHPVVDIDGTLLKNLD